MLHTKGFVILFMKAVLENLNSIQQTWCVLRLGWERVGEEDMSFDCSRANLAYYSYKKAPNALCHHEGKKHPFVPCFKWICNPGSAFLLSHY